MHCSNDGAQKHVWNECQNIRLDSKMRTKNSSSPESDPALVSKTKPTGHLCGSSWECLSRVTHFPCWRKAFLSGNIPQKASDEARRAGLFVGALVRPAFAAVVLAYTSFLLRNIPHRVPRWAGNPWAIGLMQRPRFNSALRQFTARLPLCLQ